VAALSFMARSYKSPAQLAKGDEKTGIEKSGAKNP
jgi:hypothetical protein